MGRAWPILLLLGFCQLCASWGSLAIIAVQVEMRAGLGISGKDVAALLWAFSLSLAIGAPAAQALIGHWRRRAVLFASLTLLGCGAVALGFAQSWEQAMAARVAMALGAASVMPTASVIAASLVSPEQRPAAMAVVFGGLTASLVVALPVSSAVAEGIYDYVDFLLNQGAKIHRNDPPETNPVMIAEALGLKKIAKRLAQQ